mmetsp:Transcript_74320/g.198270  ORF Transcript_74320/g.198270 Transcript_74320/m.198270 type:complete len:89 (-) Transcript_74320:96-362(-)
MVTHKMCISQLTMAQPMQRVINDMNPFQMSNIQNRPIMMTANAMLRMMNQGACDLPYSVDGGNSGPLIPPPPPIGITMLAFALSRTYP